MSCLNSTHKSTSTGTGAKVPQAQLVIVKMISSWSSNGRCSFENRLQHRSLVLNTSRCYCGEASLSEMWQSDQSHEKLEKHAPTNMYMTTKWEGINHLITTLGLIVILQITLYAFVDFRAPVDSIYTSWLASSAIFTLCDLSSGQPSKNTFQFKVHSD